MKFERYSSRRDMRPMFRVLPLWVLKILLPVLSIVFFPLMVVLGGIREACDEFVRYWDVRE